ncbi:adenylate isopentenyltransferase 1, chloroplastic-like [Solanum verrucosum]|uniref:adenylate isopentenyltransferase 1, chloroplastic-like n=1 Tax=Solanum verrucosum TaxID=315347 RepID=UPI0020D12828|nr:adenylate isopentenyltransferase 1, chloroplastic-like [Solanum verrucosum]
MRKLSFLSTTSTNHSNTLFFFRPKNIFFFPKWTRNVVISATSGNVPRRSKKIVVIMGATGCGKSKLSIDLATHFFPSIEVINSDKIQVFNGLDITTNKISMTERCGIHHHLLGEFKPTESHPEFSSSDFRSAGDFRINEIVNRGKIPFIVGGSNSFIYALLVKRFDSEFDIFESLNPVINELRYQCCFIWVDAIAPVLNQYLDKRVDEMLDSEMFEELKEYFEKEGFSDSSSDGIRKAIGVPEFEKYFKGKISYEEAAMEIKENTRVLAERQVKKIMRLREGGWNIQKVDATATLTAKMGSEKMAGGENPARKIWEEQVLEPSAKIVKQFLLE